MIKLDCPGCNKGLEIDDGFAGGICRCYDCGTLMTVPAGGKGTAERLERASRPDRPDVPGQQAKTPATNAGETFVTATGKQIQVSAAQMARIGVAKKAHMGARVGVIAAFIAFVVLLVAALIFLSAHMLEETERDRAAQQQQAVGPDVMGTDTAAELFTYDPQVNPMFLESPNLIGLPLEVADDESIAIVVDTSAAMSRSFDFVKAVLPRNFDAIADAAKLQVSFATESGPRLFPPQSQPPANWDRPAFVGLLTELESGGALRLTDAVEQALATNPTRIVLVFSLVPIAVEMDKITAMFEGKSVKVDVIQLGRYDTSMQTYAEERGGQYIDIPTGTLDRWYREYQDRNRDTTPDP